MVGYQYIVEVEETFLRERNWDEVHFAGEKRTIDTSFIYPTDDDAGAIAWLIARNMEDDIYTKVLRIIHKSFWDYPDPPRLKVLKTFAQLKLEGLA